MIVHPFVKAAFELLKVVDPSFDEERFRETMRTYFNAETSKEENRGKMMEAIRQGILGEKLAKIASYQPKTSKSFPELIEENPEIQELMEELEGDFEDEGEGEGEGKGGKTRVNQQQ
jgi:hypothetical protein